MTLRFHWLLPRGGEVAKQTIEETLTVRFEASRQVSASTRTDMVGWTHFCQQAEQVGIDSLLLWFNAYSPEPLLVASALGQVTQTIKFIVAYRSGLIQPTSFVHQVNTLSNLIGGRVALNLVAGSSIQELQGYGDFLDHDDRYARSEEFLAICNAFWQQDAQRNGGVNEGSVNEGGVNFEGQYYRVAAGKLLTPFAGGDRTSPEIYISGHSDSAKHLALAQGSSWLRVIDTPANLKPLIAPMRAQGVEICLRSFIICRPTREEALRVARSMLPENVGSQKDEIDTRNNSQMHHEAVTSKDEQNWRDRYLWTGLVPHNGPVWIALVGTPEDLVEAFLEYKRIGITQFILSSCPELKEMLNFGHHVLPLIRQAERVVAKIEG